MGKYGTNLEGFGGFEGGVNADKGAALVSTNSDGSTALLFGPVAMREIQAGVANGDFAVTPDDASATITSTNPLPYWTFTDVSSAGAITCAIVADSSSASGNILRFTMPTGSSSSKSVTLTRFVTVPSTRNRSFAFVPEVFTGGYSTNANQTLAISTTWYKSDQTTTTGTGSSQSRSLGTGPAVFQAGLTSVNSSVPSDAAYMLITLTVTVNGTAPGSNTQLDIYEVRLISGAQNMLLAEKTTPGTYAPTIFDQANGVFNIQPPSNGSVKLSTTQVSMSDTGKITSDNANPPSITLTGASINFQHGSASGDFNFKTSAGAQILAINNSSNIVLESTGGYRQTPPPTTTQTTSGAIWFNTAGTTWELRRNTSSKRYKTDITDADATVLAAAKKIKPRHYRSTLASESSATRLGFIAEEVEDTGLTHAVAYDEDGRAETIDPTALIAALYHRVNELEERVATLEQE